jgi:hypothetical protein
MNKKEHIDGNKQIHIYMGWEIMTNQEIFDYNFSPMNLSRHGRNVDDWVKKSKNQPDMKIKGSVITNTSHNEVFYSDLLTYHESMDSLMPVIEKLTKEYYGCTDMFITMKNLLHGVYGDELSFTVENLWKRIVKLVTIINKGI